jgi:hypothetical protein
MRSPLPVSVPGTRIEYGAQVAPDVRPLCQPRCWLNDPIIWSVHPAATSLCDGPERSLRGPRFSSTELVTGSAANDRVYPYLASAAPSPRVLAYSLVISPNPQLPSAS